MVGRSRRLFIERERLGGNRAEQNCGTEMATGIDTDLDGFLMLRMVLRGRFIGRKQAKVHKKATVRQLGQSGAPSANFPLIVMKKMEPSVIFQRIGQDERVVEEPWLKVDPCLCIS